MILGKIVASLCLCLTVCGMMCLVLDFLFESRPTHSCVLSKKLKDWDNEDDFDDEKDPILNNYEFDYVNESTR